MKLSAPRRILKNLAFLAIADFFNKALVFVAVAYLARTLKAEGFGKIEFAQAIAVYFMLLANQGLATFGAREIARHNSDIKRYANHILSIRLLLALLSYILLVVFTFSVPQSAEIKNLLLIYGFAMFALSLTLDWVFQGTERMEYIALAQTVNQAAYAGGLFLLVRGYEQLLLVPVVKLAAAMIGATILLFFVNKRYGRIKLSYDPVFWRQILKQSIPMGVSLILIQIYYTFDTVMLGFMKGEAMVGWYNAAYKIVLLFIGFATLFGTVIFPVLSRYYKESLSQLRDLLFQSSRLTLFFALPIAVGGMVLSSQIIQLVYGLSYQPSVLPLKILIWSVFTVYFNCSFAFCLLACDKQKEYMYSVLAGAIVNLILNFLLIPKYDMLGASIATITCETITLALILFYSRRIVRAVPGAHLLRTLSASAAMGMVLYFVPLNLWLKILVGLVTYLLIMITIKGIKAEDIISFQKILRASHDSR